MNYQPDDDEVCFEATWSDRKVNGWNVGQVAQQLGMQAREAIKPGWRIAGIRLRLSVWLEKPADNGGDDG